MMSKWVNVKEKMPDKPGKYLTYSSESLRVTVQNFMAINSYSDNKEDHIMKFRISNGREDKHVTHWQPFPEPPKGDE